MVMILVEVVVMVKVEVKVVVVCEVVVKVWVVEAFAGRLVAVDVQKTVLRNVLVDWIAVRV